MKATCPHCSHTFEKEKAKQVCANCFACTGCEMVKCPKCKGTVEIIPKTEPKRDSSN